MSHYSACITMRPRIVRRINAVPFYFDCSLIRDLIGVLSALSPLYAWKNGRHFSENSISLMKIKNLSKYILGIIDARKLTRARIDIQGNMKECVKHIKIVCRLMTNRRKVREKYATEIYLFAVYTHWEHMKYVADGTFRYLFMKRTIEDILGNIYGSEHGTLDGHACEPT